MQTGPAVDLLMDIEIERVTIDGNEEFKLRLDGVLYGVFWTEQDARQYASDFPYNWEKDLSSRPPRQQP